MTKQKMCSMERMLTTLSHQEPDRVPLFLPLTMHGAKELGTTIKDYFSKADYVSEGQIILQKKYDNDCYMPFFYAGIETEAFGGTTIFREDGPANAGNPIIKDKTEIQKLKVPAVNKTSALQKSLKTIKLLKKNAKNKIPIVGTVISPFSLPIMQMGFEKYIDLLYFHKKEFNQLMDVNMAFCVEWANAQLDAGASFIIYFDPMSSTTIIPRDLYIETGYPISKQIFSKIKGSCATHFASGNCLPISDLVRENNAAAVCTSVKEDIAEIKQVFNKKLTVVGNLNGIEMRRWTVNETYKKVKETIVKAAPGGGFILSDNHGEIPIQVKEETLLAIAESIKKFGVYPINSNK
jgi:uroporphyrinogen decarboxylase